jgi:HAMP domain-containing protein
MLGRLSISTRFAFVFLVAIGMVAAAFYMILDRIYLNQLKSQAETVADNVDAFGTWVAQYGRVWVKDDARSYLGHLPAYQMEEGVAATASGLKPVHFYSKNPALAQREFSEVVARSASPSKFRLTSHNVMNPGNAPDPFEVAALQRIRDDGLREYFELTPDGFRYARTLYHKASCISCHGEAASAPSDVKLRYGTTHGFGFKEGEVAGIISVRLPARSFWQVAVIIVGGWQLAMILGAFLIAMLFVRFAIVNPVERLTKATHQISLAQPADLGVAGIGRSSRNELHQLAIAIDRLRRSITIAMRKLGEEPMRKLSEEPPVVTNAAGRHEG